MCWALFWVPRYNSGYNKALLPQSLSTNEDEREKHKTPWLVEKKKTKYYKDELSRE